MILYTGDGYRPHHSSKSARQRGLCVTVTISAVSAYAACREPRGKDVLNEISQMLQLRRFAGVVLSVHGSCP